MVMASDRPYSFRWPALRWQASFWALLLWLCHALFAQARAERSEVEWVYSVRPQDTIWSISRDYLDPRIPWHRLVQHNQLSSVSELPVGTQLRIPISWLRQQPEPALAEQVYGQAQHKPAQQARYQPLQPGQRLKIGDEVRTQQGQVRIRFADGSELYLNENSVLLFNTLTRFGNTGMVDTRTRLVRGSLSTRVAPQADQGSRYEIATPSAVAAVRGTHFRLKVDDQATRAEVTEGEVHLAAQVPNAEPLSIPAGYGAQVGADGRSQPLVRLPGQPALSQSPQHITKLPWRMEWQPVAGARQYVVDLYEQDLEGRKVLSKRLQEPAWQLDDVTNGGYLLALRAVNADGFEGLEQYASLVIEQSSRPALLLAPQPGTVISPGRPEFRWRLQQSSDLSSLEVARDSAFQDLLIQSNFHHQLTLQAPRQLTPGRYYWRVVTLAGGTSRSFSEARELRVIGDLPPLEIIAINYAQNRANLYWKSVPQTDTYLLQVASDAQFKDVLREEQLTGTHAAIRLPDKKRYYVRIKAVGDEFHRSHFGPGREVQLP